MSQRVTVKVMMSRPTMCKLDPTSLEHSQIVIINLLPTAVRNHQLTQNTTYLNNPHLDNTYLLKNDNYQINLYQNITYLH